MLSILEAIILGIFQGLTEFIPVSSSAHLIVLPWFFGWDDLAVNSLAFDVALHLGTLVAVLWFFSADWLRLIRAGIASLIERKIGADPDRRLAWLLVIGCIPGGIAGVLAESAVEAAFHQPNQPHQVPAMIAVAVVLALAGALMLLADRLAKHLRDINGLTLRDALIIGAGSVVTAIIAAIVANEMPQDVLRWLFVALMLVIAARIWLGAQKDAAKGA